LGDTNDLLVTVYGNASYTVETAASDADSIEGYAFMIQDGGISAGRTYGKVAAITKLRYWNSEAIIPLSTMIEHKSLVAIDNTDGFTTMGSIVNFDTKAATVSMRLFAENGELLGTDSISVPAAGRWSFNTSKLSYLNGVRGIVEFTTSNQFMSGFGMRMNPNTRTMSAYPSISLREWQQ
jgi:hypothetical protein